MDHDLERIHEQLNLACVSESSSSNVPLRSRGRLIVNDSALCITAKIMEWNETRCLPTPCGVQPALLDIDQGRLGVRKEAGIVSVHS
jgi:hypothetical protein